MDDHPSASREAEILGWRDLRAAVAARMQKAGASGAAQWRRVLDLIDARAGRGPARDAPPLVGRRWKLVRIRIAGFRGIGEEFTLDLNPRPGLTVVHAPNGSGKSSISDAVRAAIWGRPTDLTRDLWRPVDRAAGCTDAVAEVRLTCGADQLDLTWTDAPDTASTAIVRRGAGARAVSVGDPDWTSALLAHGPVFSYSQTQDLLGTEADLRGYLENLLALGPCFAQLKADVETHAANSTAAAKALTELKKSAKLRVDALDEDFAQESGTAPNTIAWPRLWNRDPDEWLAAQAFVADVDHADYDLPAELAQRTAAVAGDARDALADVTATEADLAVDTRIHSAVLDLHHAVAADPPGGSCPVCATETDWFAQLRSTAERLTAWDAARRRLNVASGRLLGLVRDEIRPLAAAATRFGIGVTRLENALSRLSAGSAEAAVDQRGALSDLTDTLLDAAFGELVEHVSARCDRSRRWQQARRAAVDELITLWRRTGALAAERNDWSEADKKLTRLRNDLRDGRSEHLADAVGAVFARLLPDADLRLGAVSLRKTGDADPIRMTNGAGHDLRLGTLSAGQRNALLLAPLLRLPAEGPFGFLIVDDPVHAFDELRVDLLAEELVRLAEHRRVVVLTHDGRLQEMLTARVPDTELRTLRRAGGTVTETARSRPWQSLLDDAESVVRLGDQARNPAALGRLTGLVRGTCRHAVDGAIRELALRWSVLSGASAEVTLEEMNAQLTTRNRLDWAARFHVPGTPSPAAAAQLACHDHITGWNGAAHGADETAPIVDLRRELDAARRACTILTAWGRS